ncbi:MAG: MBL fold metallo-hydrolase [Kofleriaceae bacterium]
MVNVYKAAPDIDVLTTSIPIAHLGCVPINAFVLHGPEPVLVDTGVGSQREAFMAALRSVIDPAALRWIWLTHPDPDHTGSLAQLLADNPRVRVVTTFLGVGIMGLTTNPLPMDRVYLVNPGEQLALPDRRLTAFKPPVFDNPSTTGLFDDRSRVLFSSDCFGAILPAPPQDAAELSDQELRDGQVLWTSIDAPWLHKVDTGMLARELDAVRRLEPAMILSSHLPVAPGRMTNRLLSAIGDVPAAPPFIGPNQAALEQMMASAS